MVDFRTGLTHLPKTDKNRKRYFAYAFPRADCPIIGFGNLKDRRVTQKLPNKMPKKRQMKSSGRKTNE